VNILITGITGMVGSHMADYILEHTNDTIYGLIRWRSPLDNIRGNLDKINLLCGDLRDLPSLVHIIGSVSPEKIFHFAASSFVTTSFGQPIDTLETNVIGTTNLLEAIRMFQDYNPFVCVASSSEVYGQVGQYEVPIKETQPFRPASPYAVSKVGEDMIAYQYWLSYSMNIVRTRMFSHTGKRRGDVFFEGSIAKQIAEIEIGKRDVVKVGNLNSVRTFMDVRDAVRAYWMLSEQPRKKTAGEVFNIGGDTTMTTGDVLVLMRQMAKCEIKFEVDPTLFRPSDVTLQIPDTTKFRKLTGWKPEIPIESTMMDLLSFWRERVAS